MKTHKAGPQKVNRYVGFGAYEDVPAPLCVGAKAVYRGRSYWTSRIWKYVDCKHCLKAKKQSGNDNKLQ